MSVMHALCAQGCIGKTLLGFEPRAGLVSFWNAVDAVRRQFPVLPLDKLDQLDQLDQPVGPQADKLMGPQADKLVGPQVEQLVGQTPPVRAVHPAILQQLKQLHLLAEWGLLACWPGFGVGVVGVVVDVDCAKSGRGRQNGEQTDEQNGEQTDEQNGEQGCCAQGGCAQDGCAQGDQQHKAVDTATSDNFIERESEDQQKSKDKKATVPKEFLAWENTILPALVVHTPRVFAESGTHTHMFVRQCVQDAEIAVERAAQSICRLSALL